MIPYIFRYVNIFIFSILVKYLHNPKTNLTILVVFYIILKHYIIWRVVRVVEGAALEIFDTLWKDTPRKAFIYKGFRGLDYNLKLVFSPSFLLILQGLF